MIVKVLPTIIFSFQLGIAGLAIAQTLLSARGGQKHTYYLTGVLIFLSIHTFGDLLVVSGGYRYFPNLVGLQFPLATLIGPAFYFYARSMMTRSNVLSTKSMLTASIGPVLGILVLLPFALGLTTEQKLSLADPLTRDAELYKFALLTCLLSTLTFLISTLLYFSATYRLLNNHKVQLMKRFSVIEKKSLDWLRTILLLWGSVWVLYTIEYILNFIGVSWIGSGVVIPMLNLLLLLAFAHLSLNQPLLSETDKSKDSDLQPRAAALDDDRMKRIAVKLHKVMQGERLFCENELSLHRLSEAIGISQNHISETLSQHLQINFFSFINNYRVEEAKRLLTTTTLSIIDISLESGFNSRSTFNSAFKKTEGVTPSAYRMLMNNHNTTKE
ncbi:helix-turn-helix transcriptional regulator [Aliiglaciecola lipolytica]|uniref:helix-turn-helix transcriptional regulator n=1 Tax=Aliiglaciecola lipolytica TaxID=477689 RepID=UPI001C095F54|nr:helix-turn-helix transcriptional regulator [Aliiglaciecola lipolytica]MBU2879995.1 helix-turn-helix transcriptional regulator [Aliiglaciecola lipolytica]